MKIRSHDTPVVSLNRGAVPTAASVSQTTTTTKPGEDAATLSLRSVSNSDQGAHADKVAKIKAQVESNTYAYDSAAVAKKLAVELL